MRARITKLPGARGSRRYRKSVSPTKSSGFDREGGASALCIIDSRNRLWQRNPLCFREAERSAAGWNRSTGRRRHSAIRGSGRTRFATRSAWSSSASTPCTSGGDPSCCASTTTRTVARSAPSAILPHSADPDARYGRRSGQSSGHRSSMSCRVRDRLGMKTSLFRSRATASSKTSTGRTATTRFPIRTHPTAWAASWSSAPKRQRPCSPRSVMSKSSSANEKSSPRRPGSPSS